MPDDDRKRRRLGDETKGRIADLASGWDAPAAPPSAPDSSPSGNAARRTPKTPAPIAARPASSMAARPGAPVASRASASAPVLAPSPLDDIPEIVDDDDDDAADALDALDAIDLDDDGATSATSATSATGARGATGGRRDHHDTAAAALAAVAAADPDGWAEPTLAPSPASSSSPPKSGRHAQRPSPARSAPTGSDDSDVDVSGLISEKTQPPERIVPIPTVDASALGAAPTSDPRPPPPSRPPSPPPSASPSPSSASPRSGTRTSPPPPPGARSAGTAAFAPTAPITSASGSGSLPASAADISSPTRPRLAPTPPRAQQASRAGRAPVATDDSALESIPLVEPDDSGIQIAPAPSAARGDETTIDPSTRRPERDDPTYSADATSVRPLGDGPVTPKARLRTIAQLHRRRGVGGDLRYVWTTIFGLRRTRRELAALEAKETLLQGTRRRHLITLGRTAISADGFEHAARAGARAQLARVEEEQAGHTAQAAAAADELQRVNRDRAEKAKQHATDLAALDAELAELGKKLEPLEKEITSVTRRAADLRDTMRRLDEKLAFTEAKLSSADVDEAARGQIQAEIASLKAERKDVKKGEPALASSLDTLHPKLAKLEAARAEARRRRAELEQAERDDQRRTEELLAAIGAKRKVLDRAASDAETLRDKILFELGERLYVDRPDSMAPELSPIDAIDVELGTVDRRTMELREILSSVDRWKLVRGVALWILILAVVGFGVALALGAPLPF